MQRDTDLPTGRATLGRLAHDAAAGANLALTMLPKAMAYAVVAGVPPVYGLYASCAAPALAVAFGSNRLLFTGPVGVMTVLVLGSLHRFAHPFSPRLYRARRLADLDGRRPHSAVRRRPAGTSCARSPPRHRGLHRRRGAHHRHAGRTRARARRRRVRASICRLSWRRQRRRGRGETFSSPASSRPASPSRSWHGGSSRGSPTRSSSSASPLRLRSPGTSARAAWRWWAHCRRGCRRSPPRRSLHCCPGSCGPPPPCWLWSA